MIWEELTRQLQSLASDNLLRRRRTLESACGPYAVIDGKPLLAFCSNDYLGLAAHPALKEAVAASALRWGTGSGGSHVVSGHMQPHEALEKALAAFVGARFAPLVSSDLQ